MIHEYVREMTEEERASLQRALTTPGPRPQTRSAPDAVAPAITLAVVIASAGGIIVFTGKAPSGGIVAAVVVGGLYALYQAVAASRRHQQVVTRQQDYAVERGRDLARMLEDGRVTVKRVRATAVIELEPFEDEGPGYLFDLGDGRVLFLKGQDYGFPDDENPWPNTEFEIVRTVAPGRMLDMTFHGQQLRPVRVVPSAELDGQKAWADREEVLEMSLDDALKTVLRAACCGTPEK